MPTRSSLNVAFELTVAVATLQQSEIVATGPLLLCKQIFIQNDAFPLEPSPWKRDCIVKFELQRIKLRPQAAKLASLVHQNET